jgi:H+/Cl- antiporter ClcA
MSETAPAAAAIAPPNAFELLRSRSYVVLLVFAAILGVPIAFAAYFFLAAVGKSQHWIYQNLPVDLGFSHSPSWWPLPMLVVAGAAVASIIHFLPGNSGHEPAEGFVAGGVPQAIELPGVILAAFATLALGAVLGPEAPLIAIGGGLGAWAVHLVKKDAPAQAAIVIGTAGSFAAISTLLGSPLVGAFLLMEAAGLGGPLLGLILTPGLLAAGVGSLIFLGLDSLTGLGTFSLSVGSLPPFTSLNGIEFLWAIAVGLLGAAVGTLIKRSAKLLQGIVIPRRLWIAPLVGASVALCAIVFEHFTSHGAGEVLFSGENSIGPLIQQAGSWSAAALVLLVACKGIAYSLSLSSFRGGPVFPAIFIGAAGGIALSHLGHLPVVAGAAMGMSAMLVTMLGLPLTSVMLTVLLLSADGIELTPLVIVAVVVAYVFAAFLAPRPPALEAVTAEEAGSEGAH